MYKICLLLLPITFLISCGGGGGGGTSGILGGPSGGGGNSYSYKKVDERISDGTVSQYDVDGVTIAQAYNSETQSTYRNFLPITESNISFATGTNTNGEQYFEIGINKYLESTPSGASTSMTYALNYSFSFTGSQTSELYNYPTHSYVWEFFSNADITVYGLNDAKTYAGTEYVDMLMWWMDYDNGFDDYVSFVYGDNTFSGDMPTSSSATYNVKSQGFWGSDGSVYIFTGDGSLTADFANMTLTGSILNDYVTDEFYGWSQLVGFSAGGISFDGTISGSDFSGTIDWGNSFGDGTFSGNFFGPNAKEIGGTYEAFADEDGYYNWIMGSFIGAQ